MTIFDILKDIIKDKTGSLTESSEFESAFNPYMIARYLSMRKSLMPYARWLNQYSSAVSKESQYKFLLQSIPQCNNHFIKYIKKAKADKVDKSDDEE